MPCNHIMLDLETLSTRTTAAIIQIAARAFDIETGELGSAFNVFVSESDETLRGHVDVKTVAFWMRQAFAPKMAAALEGDGRRGLVDAAYEFRNWYCETEAVALLGDDGADIAGVWSHGLTFDVPILTAAFERCGVRVPWHYRTPRDTRTLFDLAPGGMPAIAKDAAREHDAQYDCEYQIAQVVEAHREIELAKAAYERHRTGMNEVLDKIVALGIADTERSLGLSRAEAAVEALANPALRYDEVAPPSSDDCPVSSDYSPCAP